MKDNDYNQQAFPALTNDGYKEGMTLLDYFAVLAMQGLLTKYTLNTPSDQDTISRMSYQLAEAMMEERKKYIPEVTKAEVESGEKVEHT